MKRIVWVRVSWDVMAGILAGHALAEVTSNLPTDVRTEYLVLDHERREVRVFLTSETFEPVPEGHVIPEFWVSLTTHFPEPVR